ncbi:MAG: chorismate pyruvate-lyase family protein [Actinomycetota bacterium]|nr:chorismate pyruvate-lyase family protein [Actinomycetota bacterium]
MTTTASLLTRFQRILLGTDGTVTHILEAYADESIEAVKLAQDLDTARSDGAVLEVPSDAAVLRRRVVLRGVESGRNLLYAEAVVVTDRVNLDFLNGLLQTDQPIGRLLAEHRSETFREILLVDREPAGSCAAHLGIDSTAEVIFRTYRIVARGKPIMVITEKFPADSFRGLPG